MMKQIIVVIVVICTIVFFEAQVQAQGKAKYVGAKMCAPCHRGAQKGSQAEIWEKSNHAKAYKTLETPEADKIAKEKGLKTAAKDSPACLKCHTVGDGKDGVTCEACHGPGSEYKSMAVMKDRAKALAAGLIIASNDPKVCEKCHNSESPTYKKFEYKVSWEKIKHPMPKK
jgi:uncharacterized paraquat-inducible protein A